MKTIQSLFLAFLFVFSSCFSSEKNEAALETKINEQLIYLAMTSRGHILVDDSRTLEKNKSIIGLADTNLNYFDYVERVKQILKIRKKYDEQETFYKIDFGKDLEILTNIKPGDEFYLSLNNVVKKAVVSYYIVDLDAEIGGAPVFYPVLLLEDKTIPDEGIYVASTTPDISPTSVPMKVNEFPEIVKSMVEKFKGIEVEAYNDDANVISKPITEFGEDEIFIIKNRVNENYIVSVLKRKSFDMFVSGVFETTKNGEIVNEIVPLNEGDFYYRFISGIYTRGTESEPEFLFQEGYYEGAGYGIMKKMQGGYKDILSGFFFGV